jgi:hypothetical protein
VDLLQWLEKRALKRYIVHLEVPSLQYNAQKTRNVALLFNFTSEINDLSCLLSK